MALVACIKERNARACVAAIKNARQRGADFAEVRIDFLDYEPNITRITRDSALPVIATCRKRRDGGQYKGLENKRLETLGFAIDAGAAYVDIELETGAEAIRRLRRMAERKNCQTMVSKHSFEGTPSFSVLVKWLEKAAELGDMVKIATMARNHRDCIDILHLLDIAENRGVKLVAFAMGEQGRITRIASLALGSPLAYCSLSGEVAPGQMTIDEMKLAMGLLGVSQSIQISREQVL